ncbi:MAG: hypothetical protein UY81_C0009G0015 [Candidatus Giovannonibacteria bacterium GW2011_GWA2_53_7]|uniref:UPF0102 protein UY81_C0009G0015 n=1 Tax=Candidatus Giovannonibacteria bacterium GW2011_GWA2_53_7 TaxID=1618650 RepID=A0A0G1Y190_9BACT|nr:MAG: hypothetical protein UY81_C0009G0015 [Candidatus Giovannonibacteria bacterium GW2011_GWA2_53_7]
MDPRRLFGNEGEHRAATYLKKKGYVILDRQFRTRFGEIDLVARDGDEIVFVEVKTRRSSAHGFPEDAVTETKLQRLEIAAESYLKVHAFEARLHRFDVIALVGEEGHVQVEHLIGV